MRSSPRAPMPRLSMSSAGELQSKPKPMVVHDREYARVGQRLHGEVLAEAVDVREDLLEPLAGLPDAGLVVNVEWGPVVGDDALQHGVQALLEIGGHRHDSDSPSSSGCPAPARGPEVVRSIFI